MINAFSVWANILNQTSGRFFTVEYRKKDGTLRVLNGKVYEKMTPTSNHRHLIVRDVKISSKKNKADGGYRKIDPEAIVAFKCGSFQMGRFTKELVKGKV